MILVEKVFLWAGVRAYINKGKVVNIVEEEYLGEKHFKHLHLDGTVLKMTTKTGIKAEYDFKTKQFLRIIPCGFPLKLEDALSISELIQWVGTMQVGWDTIGRVSAKILATHPLDAPLITEDDLDKAYLDIENPSIEEIAKKFDFLVNTVWHPDCDAGIEVIIENRTGTRKNVEIQFNFPDKVLIGCRQDYRWHLLKERRINVQVVAGKHVRLTFVGLALGRVHDVGSIRVVSDGEVIREQEFSIFSC